MPACRLTPVEAPPWCSEPRGTGWATRTHWADRRRCPARPWNEEDRDNDLHSEIGSNQVGCSCTWQRSLSRETNIRATKEIPAPNQSWRGCNHPTSNWPYKGHQIPYLVPRTADCLSPLWSNTDHWPYALGVCSVVMNTTQLTRWILSSKQFLRLA